MGVGTGGMAICADGLGGATAAVATLSLVRRCRSLNLIELYPEPDHVAVVEHDRPSTRTLFSRVPCLDLLSSSANRPLGWRTIRACTSRARYRARHERQVPHIRPGPARSGRPRG